MHPVLTSMLEELKRGEIKEPNEGKSKGNSGGRKGILKKSTKG